MCKPLYSGIYHEFRLARDKQIPLERSYFLIHKSSSSDLRCFYFVHFVHLDKRHIQTEGEIKTDDFVFEIARSYSACRLLAPSRCGFVACEKTRFAGTAKTFFFCFSGELNEIYRNWICFNDVRMGYGKYGKRIGRYN